MPLRIICCLLLAFLTGDTALAEDRSTPDLPPARPLPSAARFIGLDEAEKLVANPEIPVLDVRWLEEYKTLGHLPRAISLDVFRSDFAAGLETLELAKDQPCVIYCALGGRSKRAAEKMASLGYRDLRIIEGGFSAWKKAGKPIVGVGGG